MNINEVINTKIINLHLTSHTKQEALGALINMLFNDGRIDDKAGFLAEVLKREETETTDLGFGVAIPHGMCAFVRKPSVAIGKLLEPISWQDGEDQGEEPVYAIFLMATSPDEKGRSHIEIISKVASLLIEDEFVEFLRNNNDKEKLLKKIKSYLGDK